MYIFFQRPHRRSFKTTLAASILAFATVVSVATWYYVIGQSRDGESGMGISLTPSQIDSLLEPPIRVDQTATEWYAPGEIQPTSKVITKNSVLCGVGTASDREEDVGYLPLTA